MDKCREAFEKLPVIEEIMGDDYVMFDEQFKKYLCGVGENEEYLNGAWMVWQSRQTELDQLNEVLDERTKEWLEAIKLGTYFQEAAKPLKDKVDQLQSQINEMAEVGLSQESELNKKDEHAHNLYYENANLQTLVEEKDKRIESALYVLKGLKAENDLWGCDQVEVQIEILEKALRGAND